MKDEGYVSDDSVGEDGSEQGDVVNGLFAEYENSHWFQKSQFSTSLSFLPQQI